MNLSVIHRIGNNKICKRILSLFIGIAGLIYLLYIMDTTVLENQDTVYITAETSTAPSGLDIYTLDDYLTFVRNVNQGDTYDGQYINLYTDLDFSGVTENITIGTAGTDGSKPCQFLGIFDGNAHHIRNLNIQSESAAGLFRNLGGIVCNLVIESGSIAGSPCGAIASTTDEEAYILNCSSYAEVYGDTIDGISGDSNGTVQNCISSFTGFDETMIASLNQGLCGFSDNYQTDDWYLWEMADGQPSLSTTAANLPSSIHTTFRIDREEVNISAYYSQRNEAWCFALPAGCENAEFDITLCFSGGETAMLHRAAGLSELSYELDSILYPIEILTAQKAPTLMIDTHTSDALSYLHSRKTNTLPGTYLLFQEDGTISNEGRLDKIRGHGNDSWLVDKKSYNLTFHESEDLLNIGAGENYTLLSAYRDNSLLAYKLTYDLSNEIGMDYPPNANFVHLYIDGKYLGMYLLVGKIEIGENRFALKDMYFETERLNHARMENYELKEWHSEDTAAKRFWADLDRSPEDVTGGYILEIDNLDYDVLKSRFVTDRDTTVVLRSASYASKEQVDYIADFWQDFENALYAEDGYNDKGKYYADYIDLESFADQWLMYELNEDYSFSSSIYFYKDSDLTGDGLLHASWLWDAEHSLTYNDFRAARSFFALYSSSGWWMQLYRHQDFAEIVYQEWMQKFVPALEKALSPDAIDNTGGIGSLNWYLNEYGDDGRLNNTRWLKCNYEDKMARIQYVYTVRKDFMTKALALYDSGYSYYYEADGVFYGVTADGEEVIMESAKINE